MQVHRPLGDGGHGSVWTMIADNRKRAQQGRVIKTFHTNSCLDWEVIGNQFVIECFQADPHMLRKHTCLLVDESVIPINVCDKDGKAVKGLVYRRVNGVTFDGSRPKAQRACFGNQDGFLQWSISLAHVLDAMHEGGVLHNDVKPHNIMDEDHHPVLIDFGITVQLTPDMDIRKENTTELYMDPQSLCWRKARRRKSAINPEDTYRLLKRSWRGFPWAYLDEVARTSFNAASYTLYVAEALNDNVDRIPAPRTRDIFGYGMSLLEVSFTTYGYFVAEIKPLVTACLRVGPNAHTCFSDVLSACGLNNRHAPSPAPAPAPAPASEGVQIFDSA